MSPTLAVVLLVIAFAIVGVLGLRFLAGETRRFDREHEEFMTKHRGVMDAANRGLGATQRPDAKMN